MLTQAGCDSRRARLWRELPETIESVLVTDPRHVHYLANFWIPPYSFSDKERGWLLLERVGRATLLADNFTLKSSSVGEALVDDVVSETWYDHRHAVKNRDHVLVDALRDSIRRFDVAKCLVEAEATPMSAIGLLGGSSTKAACSIDGRNIETTLGTLIRRLRRQKEPDEIELLKKCMSATEAGHARARAVIAPGLTEFDVYAAVHAAVLEAAQRPVVIYGDFRATSAKTPKQGGLPTHHTLADGELFLLDYSVVMDGYRSDFTNAYAVGSTTQAQQELFSLCAAGLESGAKALRAGATAKEVWRAASQPLIEGGYADGIPHHAGHGIGLGHPEDPILVRENETVLLENDVVTLEPGRYVEGIGGVRVEHNYRITGGGCERLSHHEVRL